MDLNRVLSRREPAVLAGQSMTARGKRAHEQFAREYAIQLHIVRDALADAQAQPGSER